MVKTYDGEHEGSITITGHGAKWVFTASFYLETGGGIGLYEESGVGNKNNTILMNGFIHAMNGMSGASLYGQHTHFTIGKTGVITGEGGGILLGGNKVDFDNHGLLTSQVGSALITTGDDASVHNWGTIRSATDAALNSQGETPVFINEAGGVLQGNNYALIAGLSVSTLKLVNHGFMQGGTWAVRGGDGKETIINDGNVFGDIRTNGGNDLLDNRGGVVRGDFYGGNGNDTLIIDHKTSMEFIENSGQGNTDTVKSSVTYALPDYVERLYLTGKANIDGTGNSQANLLKGNSGNNTLTGAGNTDRLDGGAGNDMLIGGAEADTYVFRTNYGKDTIDGLELGLDEVDISGWKAIKNLNMVKAHAEVHGDDVWIQAGHDILVIRDIDKADLNNVNFSF